MEYALAAGMVAVAAVAAMPALAATVNKVFSRIGSIVESSVKGREPFIADCLRAPGRGRKPTNARQTLAGARTRKGLNMNWLNNHLLKLKVWKDIQGQDLVEYALMAGMVAVAAVAVLPQLNSVVSNVFAKITSKIVIAMP